MATQTDTRTMSITTKTGSAAVESKYLRDRDGNILRDRDGNPLMKR